MHEHTFIFRKNIEIKLEQRYIRLVHRFIKSMPSLTKSLGISASSWKVSDIVRGGVRGMRNAECGRDIKR